MGFLGAPRGSGYWLCWSTPSCSQSLGYAGVPLAGHAHSAEVGGNIIFVACGEFTEFPHECPRSNLSSVIRWCLLLYVATVNPAIADRSEGFPSVFFLFSFQFFFFFSFVFQKTFFFYDYFEFFHF